MQYHGYVSNTCKATESTINTTFKISIQENGKYSLKKMGKFLVGVFEAELIGRLLHSSKFDNTLLSVDANPNTSPTTPLIETKKTLNCLEVPKNM